MILVDSSFWVALFNQRDSFHRIAHMSLWSWNAEVLVCTWAVIAEVTHLLRVRAGLNATLEFMDKLALGVCLLPELPHDAAPRMARLMHRYKDLPMDLADASLVVLAEHLGEGRILSTDRDFGIYRWGSTRPFRNLLLPEQ